MVGLGPDEERIAELYIHIGGSAVLLGQLPVRVHLFRISPVHIARDGEFVLRCVEGRLRDCHTVSVEDKCQAERVCFQVVGVDDGIRFQECFQLAVFKRTDQLGSMPEFDVPLDPVQRPRFHGGEVYGEEHFEAVLHCNAGLDDGTFAGFDGGFDVVPGLGNRLDVHVHRHHLRTVHGAHVRDFAGEVTVQLVVEGTFQEYGSAFVVLEERLDHRTLGISTDLDGRVERQERPEFPDVQPQREVVLHIVHLEE